MRKATWGDMWVHWWRACRYKRVLRLALRTSRDLGIRMSSGSSFQSWCHRHERSFAIGFKGCTCSVKVMFISGHWVLFRLVWADRLGSGHSPLATNVSKNKMYGYGRLNYLIVSPNVRELASCFAWFGFKWKWIKHWHVNNSNSKDILVRFFVTSQCIC